MCTFNPTVQSSPVVCIHSQICIINSEYYSNIVCKYIIQNFSMFVYTYASVESLAKNPNLWFVLFQDIRLSIRYQAQSILLTDQSTKFYLFP